MMKLMLALKVPIFTSLGNHDYRQLPYSLGWNIDLDSADLLSAIAGVWVVGSDNNIFTTTIGSTQTASAAAFVPSKGNVIVIVAGTTIGTGWAATVTNPAVTGTPGTCGIWIGSGTAPDASLTTEGAPGCY